MPSPKVFISSACYDLGMAREQLRTFLLRMGYEPIMSEYSDVLYDPRTHTHSSCLQEIPNVDMVVVLIGSRFGGKTVPEALSNINLENLSNTSFDIAILDEPEKLSITQLEVLKAIDSSVPIFAFVEEKVMHDHLVYQKNKDIVEKITFPSIDNRDSAKYIFEFINFLRHRNTGNSVISFGKIEDIEIYLKKQWGALFQRLLREQREQSHNTKKMFTISEQIEDLKTAVISTIANSQSRDVARGVIKYRRLLEFLSGLNLSDFNVVIESNILFEKLLEEVADIIMVKDVPNSRHTFGQVALIKKDNTFYELRFGREFLGRIAIDWQNFISLIPEVRKIIFEAISDIDHMRPGIIRYRTEKFDVYFKEYLEKEDLKIITLEELLRDNSSDDVIEN